MKRQWSMVGAIVLFLIVAYLSVLNVDSVPMNFGFTTVEWPLILIIFVSVLIGALIATLLSTFKVYKDHNKEKKESRRPTTRKTRSGNGLEETKDTRDVNKPNNELGDNNE
ncbi:LapA family protein [Alkalibacterium olivapovliticus]|uniref:Putative integral membrane protein n=1 Tax=Alkalibacterium olivapovliticus TaxID=99907 RepID=A0A2T0WBM0_9LACT|nr:lipopolysaccharide assembly protein LapA domain-containing protein [Alkalibacterium olivapovliticus]PRY84101.1 putative integral membrane protein [Alkalibacterium olivapovliticus]